MTRTIVVTGAASGLGAALREQLEAEGRRVVGVDLAGAEVDADLGTAEGRDRALRQVRERTDDRVDGLVPCAGLGPHHDPATIVAVNLFGALELLDGLRDALARGTTPAAVAIGSNSATIDPTVDGGVADLCVRGDEAEALAAARELAGHSAYATSKHALARAVRHRAASWGEHGIRLNVVAPGPFESPLLRADLDDPELGPIIESLPIPLGARAGAGDVADVVRFLLSPAASYVHGSVLYVDGGIDALLHPDRVP